MSQNVQSGQCLAQVDSVEAAWAGQGRQYWQGGWLVGGLVGKAGMEWEWRRDRGVRGNGRR